MIKNIQRGRALLYQYLLGKVSTRVHRPACSGLSRYQYLLGKVSTKIKNAIKTNKQIMYQYLLGKVSTDFEAEVIIRLLVSISIR